MENQQDNFRKNDFNILIVDDRKENLLALTSLLIDQPCPILTASSGQEALELLLNYEFFLILLDVQMPEMDGFETAELIRKHKRTMHIPIIFITAIGREQDFIFKGYQSGAVDYLLKPIIPEILKKKINIFYELYQQKKMLAEKNAELKRMFYIASHDLRSPLINIHGFANELNHYFSTIKKMVNTGSLPEEAQKVLNPLFNKDIPQALEYINTSVKTIDNLLKGLLKISRIGEVALNRQQLDIDKLIEDILLTIQFQIKEKNILISADTLPTCYADTGLIHQVFSNLINNALKYNDKKEGGYIKITGSKWNFYSVYSIKDNGIGIPETDKDKIFDLFYRVNPESTISGDGIGLTAVKLILERNNGKIWVESKLGEGTTFHIALPANKEE